MSDNTTTVTKADLAKYLMDKLPVGKEEAETLLNAFLQTIVESLKRGDGVELRGFGSFRLRDRKARQGRNPRSGETIQVPPKRVVYFKLGKELRSKLID
ncbi:MAG: HU family DNA-binding protein [Holophagaceae bacterium]|jgi:integration host factor subunit beta